MTAQPNIQAQPAQLPPIALQLSHPDACFYQVSVGENSVGGFFEGGVRRGNRWQTWSAQPFDISLDSFFEACIENRIIIDYEKGLVYFDDQPKGLPARKWAAYWLDENVCTRDFYAVLKDAVTREFDGELTQLARTIASGIVSGVEKRIYRTQDEEFCDAVTRLAAIIQAVNE